MEMQAYQSQEFDVAKQPLFDATLSVLQDAGYIIESAELNSGFITGKAPTKSKMSMMWGAMNQGGKVTATISARGDSRSRLRLLFVAYSQRKSAWNPAQDVIEENGIAEPEVYRHAFSKISEALFIAKAQK